MRGRPVSEEKVKRIQQLLRDTDMTIDQIARRMDCSAVTVTELNRKYEIRLYEGKRTSWRMKESA